ncbi:zinc-dependent alcohol dehydrogenase [Mycobacterium sp.]|uniref:zinc-dependent alcohol dehydrogenase n=1 Tax=Mycobacterium sp. TaxID=1785 RepID=UPI003BA978CB
MDSVRARALVLERPRSLTVRECPLPTIGTDDALVRVEACGLCGTDHEQYTGELAGGFAFVPGHETVGTIEQIGPQAAERWGVAVGDRVAVEVFQSCRECENCLGGEYRRCIRHGLADMYGFIPFQREPGLWGGYAEYQYLAPDSMVLPVADGMSPEVATLFNPLGAGIRWGVTVPETQPGDVVAVLGPGIRGLCAAAAAKEAGAGFVMVTGLGFRDADRLALAVQFGADLAVDVGVDDPVVALEQAAGTLADVVIDVTAKAPSAFAQAIALARPAAKVVVAGTRGIGGGAPGFSPDILVFKELQVIGALGVDAAAYRAALDLLASGRYPFASLPRRCVRLEEVEDLLATMAGERDGIPPVHGVLTP